MGFLQKHSSFVGNMNVTSFFSLHPVKVIPKNFIKMYLFGSCLGSVLVCWH